MNIETLKIDLAKQLFNISEESVLEQIKDILDKKEVVAYSIDGKPLTAIEYNDALTEAEKDITTGKTISSENLRKEVSAWKR